MNASQFVTASVAIGAAPASFMTNAQLIEHTLSHPNASAAELDLAERLNAALEELDRLAAAVRPRRQKRHD